MDGRGEINDRLQRSIGRGPVMDGLFQIIDVAKILKQPDEAGNVVGMVAALQKAAARRGDIGRSLLKGDARGAVAQRHGDGLLVAPVDQFVAGFGIAVEIVDRVVLAP